ncbi:ribbon-helix-helix protein, CopG family [Thauera humireducens]|uniref:ribbon-helix-helix protein, CopG family n=1 Tax=Thauera humireducens TaxID=1134435 RepID=UPI0024A8889B|nr:ribbon-helix-helix protein, CopG family [Thauera humireducens]
MAITSKPKPKVAETAVAENAAAEAFISGAPDASTQKAPATRREVKKLISLKIAPTLLERVDQLAAELGQSRAAVINLAIHRAVERGLEIDGLGKA